MLLVHNHFPLFSLHALLFSPVSLQVCRRQCSVCSAPWVMLHTQIAELPQWEGQREVLYSGLWGEHRWEWRSLRHLQKTSQPGLALFPSWQINPFPSYFVLPKHKRTKAFPLKSLSPFTSASPKSRPVPGWPQLCPGQVLSGNSVLQIFRVLWVALLYIPVPLRATCKGTAISSPFSLLSQLYTSHKAQEIDLFYFWGREVFHWCLLWPLHTARYLLFLILASLAVHSFEILLHQKAVMVICYTCLMSHKMKWQMICSAYN